jgi:glycosyltransferase involved in cell wall biosynthesis
VRSREISWVCLVTPPFRDADQRPIQVPPQGYGGIQWSLAGLIDGLLSFGVPCALLGAPGSSWDSELVEVADAFERDEICDWIARRRPPVVSDFANFSGLDSALPADVPYCTTWQLTGTPAAKRNPIYVSYAQRAAGGGGEAPVIRLPADPRRYEFDAGDDGYLLFLGRVSPWKGAYEAALLGQLAELPVVIAGPTWEPAYRATIERAFGDGVRFAGEVHGSERRRLLARAKAVVALSQPVQGPWGERWIEPGAAVVAEAAMSGTPVIGSDNGCLAEIVPEVGVTVPGGDPRTVDVSRLIASLPSPASVRDRAIALWRPEAIAQQYLDVYQRVGTGHRWH